MRKWLPILLPGLFCLGLYLVTLTSVHTYDALSYILDVDRKPWPELFHPHHLAYGPFGALIRGAARLFGWVGSAERLLQLANALAGAFGVALFGALAGVAARPLREGGPARLAGATAGLLLGASYAYWYYAVEVEVYTIAAVFLIICLWLLLDLARDPSPRLAAALGVAQGCAVLFHQTNVLLCVPALVALLIGRDQGRLSGGGSGRAALSPWSSYSRLLAAYALPLALIVGAAYLGVGLGVSGMRSWDEVTRWAAGYTTTGLWGGPLGLERLGRLGVGLSESLLEQGGLLVVAALTLIPALLWRGLRAAPRGAVAICLSWLVSYGAFFLWWEPDNIEFWIASMPPFYLLLTLAVHGSPLKERNAGTAVVLTCVAALLVSNGVTISRRGDPELDRQRLALGVLVEGSGPGDLFIAPDDVLELYLPFYAGRDHVTSLSQAMAATQGDWEQACELLQGRIDAALAAGYEVRIALRAMEPLPAPFGEPPTPAERFGLSQAEIGACYLEERAGFTYHSPPSRAMVSGYYLLPGAQALAAGPGWDFRRGQWGWRAANAETIAFDSRGWVLRPGLDPALESPPLQLEAGRYSAIEVVMAAETVARDAQLFFRDAAGQVDEARALRWRLEPGAEMHTYTLPLRDAPGWEGTITGFRLDPVGAGDGERVVIQSLRLVP